MANEAPTKLTDKLKPTLLILAAVAAAVAINMLLPQISIAEGEKVIPKESPKLTAPGPSVGMPLPLAGVSLQGLAGRVIKTVLGLSGVVALIMFIYGGVMWMTAAGNEERLKKAKNTLVWSTIGLIGLFGSYTLVSFVINALSPLAK